MYHCPLRTTLFIWGQRITPKGPELRQVNCLRQFGRHFPAAIDQPRNTTLSTLKTPPICGANRSSRFLYDNRYLDIHNGQVSSSSPSSICSSRSQTLCEGYFSIDGVVCDCGHCFSCVDSRLCAYAEPSTKNATRSISPADCWKYIYVAGC